MNTAEIPSQNPEKRLSQAEANEAIKYLKEKIDEIAISLKTSEDIVGFSQRMGALSDRIMAEHPDDYQDYAAFHALVGSSFSPEDCKAVDFPEDELSCQRFIEAEYEKIQQR